jgi:HK97 family phage prohead protease
MPYPSEHSCRLLSPRSGADTTRRNGVATVSGKKVDHIYQRQSDGKMGLQAVRFNKRNGWDTAAATKQARDWCGSAGGSFEAMKKEEKKNRASLSFDIDRKAMFSFLKGMSASDIGEADLKDFDYAEKMMRRNPSLFKGPDVPGISISRRMPGPNGSRYGVGPYVVVEHMIRSINESDRTIDGYFQLPSNTGDGRRVRSHSFDKDIKSFLSSPLLLYGHNRERPIGLTRELAFEDSGSWMKSEVFDDEVWKWIVEKRVRGLSWAGSILDYAWIYAKNKKDVIFEVRRAELFEISVVTVPAHRETVFANPDRKARVIKRGHNLVHAERSDVDSGNRFEIYFPFERVDPTKREVWGYGCRFDKPYEPPFSDYMEKGAMEKALPKWLEWRNIREMHGGAVGKAFHVSMDKKGVLLGVRISEGAEPTWKKVKDGTLRGFSIGGVVTDRGEKNVDGDIWPTIKECEIDEWSLVDRPGGGQACAIQLVRRLPDGYDVSGDIDDIVGESEEGEFHQFGKVSNGMKGATGNSLKSKEPKWSEYVSSHRSLLPRAAYAQIGYEGKPYTWLFPHHWLSGKKLYLHKEGLIRAFGLDPKSDRKILKNFFNVSDEGVFELLKDHSGFSVACENGLTGSVLAHLQDHRRAIAEEGGRAEEMTNKKPKAKVKIVKAARLKPMKIRVGKALKEEFDGIKKEVAELRKMMSEVVPVSGRKRVRKSNTLPVGADRTEDKKKVMTFKRQDGTFDADAAAEVAGAGILAGIPIGGEE